ISSLRTTPPPPRSTLFPYTTLFRSTGFDAERTGAALIRDFFAVVFQFEIQQQFADENPRTVILCDQVCMFAYPAESGASGPCSRSEEHTSELQSRFDLVCRLLLEKK